MRRLNHQAHFELENSFRGRVNVINVIFIGKVICQNKNAYMDIKTATSIYVGTPQLKGFWVDAAQYPQALKDYNARKALSDQDTNESSQSGD